MMLGFHVQNALPNWLNAVAKLPAGAPVKCVDDYFMARDVKRTNPGVVTIFRHVYWPQQPSDDYNANLETARHFFSAFIDGTFWREEIWRYLDYIEEWNEYLANTTGGAELARWLSWNKAVQTVWREYQTDFPELGHIRLVCCNTAVGNTIPVDFARQVKSFGNVLAYHGYTHFSNGQRDPLDWQYHSGRWTTMDATYKAQGVTVDWLSTESGPYYSVFDGWKSPNVLGGNFDRYLDECVRYQLDHITAWNKANGNRFKGAVFFTTSTDKQWDKYNLGTGELERIADVVATYAPTEPPPQPPPDDWKVRAWTESVRRQIEYGIQLNPAVGIQQQIIKDGNLPTGALIPVLNEYQFEGRTYQPAEAMDGSKPRRLYWWTAVDGVHWFEEPEGYRG